MIIILYSYFDPSGAYDLISSCSVYSSAGGFQLNRSSRLTADVAIIGLRKIDVESLWLQSVPTTQPTNKTHSRDERK